MSDKKLQQVKVLLLKDTLPFLEAALRPDDNDRLPVKHDLASDLPFAGAIYMRTVSVKTPDWLPFVNSGLAEPQSLKTSTASAVLLLESPGGHRFALTFGYGRSMLWPTAYIRDFGVRVALNSVEPSKIRSVDMRRVEGLTLHTRRQASRASGLTTFGINKRHDLIQAVAGLPADDNLGRRFEGSDAFTLATYVDFRDLGDKCDQLYEMYAAEHLPDEFGFFDNFRVVRESEKIAELNARLAQALEDDNFEKMHLAQPEAESLADINYYRFTDKGPGHLELDVEEMVVERKRSGHSVTPEVLSRDYMRVSYGHQAGHDLAKWPLFDCLVFETEDTDGAVYMLSAGQWHRASAEFVAEVNAQLATLPMSGIEFPAAYEGEIESEYNKRAARRLDCTCADRANVTLPNQTPIEICDLVTRQGQFVHVKRKTTSSTLSHLFNQGFVFATMLLQHRPFREQSRKTLGGLDPDMAELVPLDAMDPTRFEVVFAVIAKPGTKLPGSLPLFSKITLAEASALIQEMGYRVSTALIPTVGQGAA